MIGLVKALARQIVGESSSTQNCTGMGSGPTAF